MDAPINSNNSNEQKFPLTPLTDVLKYSLRCYRQALYDRWFAGIKRKRQWRLTTDTIMSFLHHLSSAGPFQPLMSELLEAN